MLYKIGEIAEILGVTKEGVRFLERKGLLHSTRTAHNGYRYYSRSELSAVQQIRSYAAAGFTLEEAANLVLYNDEHYMLAAIEEKEQALEEEIRGLENKRRLLRIQKEAINQVFHLQREPEVRSLEAIYYFPVEGEYAMEGGVALREAEKQWMTAGPDVKLAKLPLDEEGQELESKGMCVEAEKAKQLGLSLEGSVFMPGGLHVTACICTPVGSRDDFFSVYCWAVKHGWKPVGNMVSVVWLSTVRDGERCTLKMVRMAVISSEKQNLPS